MLGISYDKAIDKNLIRFPDPAKPINLFFIEDGQSIVIHDSFTRSDRQVACKAIGSGMHFEADNSVYHIMQFAELMAKNKRSYEPAAPLSDLSLFSKKFLDRSLVNEDGKFLPYRVIWCNNDAFLGAESWFAQEMPREERMAVCLNPDAPTERQVCFVDGNFNKEFGTLEMLRNRISDIEMLPFERRQVLASAFQIALAHSETLTASELKAWRSICPENMDAETYYGVASFPESSRKSIDQQIQSAKNRTSDPSVRDSEPSMSGRDNHSIS